MATLEQNIESVGIIFQEIGEAINEMYERAYMEKPVVFECDATADKHATPPSEYAKLIREIPQDLELDPTMYSARIGTVTW